MNRRWFFAVSVGSVLLFLEPLNHGRVMLAAQTAPAPNGATTQPGAPDNLRVVLLGSGMGPRVNLQQFGASTLVEAGSVLLLFDCGRGATLRLAQAGVPVGSVSRLFLTHLHSDHVVQIPDLLLTGWAGGGRTIPLEVWGPKGTREMMADLQRAFAFDIHMRRDVDEKLAADGIKVVSHDINEGVVLDEQGVKVTARIYIYAFLVDQTITDFWYPPSAIEWTTVAIRSCYQETHGYRRTSSGLLRVLTCSCMKSLTRQPTPMLHGAIPHPNRQARSSRA